NGFAFGSDRTIFTGARSGSPSHEAKPYDEAKPYKEICKCKTAVTQSQSHTKSGTETKTAAWRNGPRDSVTLADVFHAKGAGVGWFALPFGEFASGGASHGRRAVLGQDLAGQVERAANQDARRGFRVVPGVAQKHQRVGDRGDGLGGEASIGRPERQLGVR